MKQNISKTIPGLVGAASAAMGGAESHGDAIGLFHGSAPKIAADKFALLSARDSYEQGKATLAQKRELLRQTLQRCREALRLSRDVLKQYLGLEYNRLWDMTGMVGSLALPKTPIELLPLLEGFQAHLASNPEHENARLKITAVDMASLYNDLLAATNAVLKQQAVVENLLAIRNDKAERLYKRIRICIDELDLLIEPLDPRWVAFGFNKPGAEATPQAPEKPEAIVINETTVMLEIPPTPLANHYRVYQRIVGVDAEPVAIGSPSDPDFTIENLRRGATIEFYATAVNSGGESVLSEKVVVNT